MLDVEFWNMAAGLRRVRRFLRTGLRRIPSTIGREVAQASSMLAVVASTTHFCGCAARAPECPPSVPMPAQRASAPSPSVPLDDPARCEDMPESLPTTPGHDAPAAAPPEAASKQKPSGKLAPEVIRHTVRERYGAFRSCYEAGLTRHGDLKGRVTLRFVIERDGGISHIRVASNEVPDCVMVDCLRARATALQFPPPSGGIVTVQYPMFFETADEAAEAGAPAAPRDAK
jgi:hypothetical protein